MTTTTNSIEKVFNQYEMLKEAEAQLAAQIEEIRAEIRDITEEAGGRYSGYGYDTRIVAETTSVTYDPKAVEAMIATLISTGQASLAQQLVAGRRINRRSEYLRIARSKE